MAITVLLALLVTFVAPTAFAEDPPTDETTASTSTETTPEPSESPSPEPEVTTEESSPSPEPEPGPEAKSASSSPTGSASEASPAAADEAPAAAPTISSDKDDYPPGGTVFLTGTNWQPGELVHIRVNDDQGETWRRDVDVIADLNGSILDEFQLPDWFVAVYRVTATGPLSGTATATFTDGNLKVLPDPTSVAFTLTWKAFNNSTSCSGAAATQTDTNVTHPSGRTISVGNNDSVELTAAATSNGGASFDQWIIPSGVTTNPSPVPAGTRTVCVSGNFPSTKDFLARYSTNRAPTISDIADQTINEDANTGALTFSVGDAETAAGSLTVSGSSSNTTLVPNANIVFGGSGASRTVTVTPVANKHGTATITVTVSDGSLSSSDTFLLTVRSVNDAPAGADDTVTTNEDTAYTFAADHFSVSDPNDSPANDLHSVKVTTLPTDGTLKLDGVAVTAGQLVSKTDIDAGKLTFHPDADENGSPYATFTFQVKDDGGVANGGVDLDQSPNTMRVNVTAVNDAPVIGSASFGGSVACPAAPGANNATLSVAFADVDNENPDFTATFDWDNDGAVDEGPIAVTEPYFTHAHSYPTVGTYTARVTVSDGSLTDTETATVTVNYTTSGILQPVNWTQAKNDPSIFKHGSTIPVKVQFFNCDGTNAGSGLSVKIGVKKISGTTPATGDPETITNTNSPDSGGFMRWAGDLYIYNLNTGTLSDKTATYEITLTVVSTGQTVTTQFGTKAK